MGALVSVCAGSCVRRSCTLPYRPGLTIHSRLLLIFVGPFRNNLLTHMSNLCDEENMISVELLCVNACWDEHDAEVLVSNKQSFQFALL